MNHKKKSSTGPEEWRKIIAGLALALAATAVAGYAPSAPAQRPAISCVTLRALSLAGPAA
jgi:hypothetical protein